MHEVSTSLVHRFQSWYFLDKDYCLHEFMQEIVDRNVKVFLLQKKKIWYQSYFCFGVQKCCISFWVSISVIRYFRSLYFKLL